MKAASKSPRLSEKKEGGGKKKGTGKVIIFVA